jgi:leucyl-tRNA---protein transferase
LAATVVLHLFDTGRKVPPLRTQPVHGPLNAVVRVRHHAVMRVLQQFTSDAHTCAYLPDRLSTLEYAYAPVLTAQEYEDLMNRGFRKFGALFFQPVCHGCRECRPIRIPTARFRPDRSQRRAWKRNQDLTVRRAAPSVDEARLDLYQRYHSAQSSRKGWPEQERDAREYAFGFVENPVPAIEITMWEGNTLRAVVLTDITPGVVSGVYHYHDPDLADRGLGTFCMLHTLELARELEKTWAYFGYYVAGCGSLEYKARFRPCEIMGADGVWRELAG